MDNRTTLIIIVALVAVVIVTILILINNYRKSQTKKEVGNLYIRFNAVKTVPLAFKLNKAQAMAKRNEQTAEAVQEYYQKYEDVEKKINEIQELLNLLDDALSVKNYVEVKQDCSLVDTNLSEVETIVKEIDTFLDDFSKKENAQREYSARLKEEYRTIKLAVNDNGGSLSIAYDALVEKMNACEDLFSSSEEWIYASDYISAQEDLEKIEKLLVELRNCGTYIPSLIKDVKGVLPLLIDEVKREYALTKQRGIYLDHLDADNKLVKIDENLNLSIQALTKAEIDGVKKRCDDDKDILNDLLESFEKENRSYKEARETNDKALVNMDDLDKIENYVRVAYDKDSARFGLENLQEILKKQREDIEKYRKTYMEINEDLSYSTIPAFDILTKAEQLLNATEADKKNLYAYKMIIDKSNDGEIRANSQLTKLQIVVSEVETKVAEYHLPSISSTFVQDLAKSRGYIVKIKDLLKEIPINIDELNVLLDEAIDFVYKFYNNVNNVVGMAIMVENAIVFGNKYRSTYPEIDRELSKAEFQYLNGEYTKALKTAISCIETIFPDNADEKILESN